MLALLGGHGYLADIYEFIEERSKMKLTKTWKSSIRSALEEHSSDSAKYKISKRKNKNMFFLVEVKGKEHWGLRNFETSDINIDITEDDEGFAEGKKKLRQHICRERNYRVIKLAKERFKKSMVAYIVKYVILILMKNMVM